MAIISRLVSRRHSRESTKLSFIHRMKTKGCFKNHIFPPGSLIDEKKGCVEVVQR